MQQVRTFACEKAQHNLQVPPTAPLPSHTHGSVQPSATPMSSGTSCMKATAPPSLSRWDEALTTRKQPVLRVEQCHKTGANRWQGGDCTHTMNSLATARLATIRILIRRCFRIVHPIPFTVSSSSSIWLTARSSSPPATATVNAKALPSRRPQSLCKIAASSSLLPWHQTCQSWWCRCGIGDSATRHRSASRMTIIKKSRDKRTQNSSEPNVTLTKACSTSFAHVLAQHSICSKPHQLSKGIAQEDDPDQKLCLLGRITRNGATRERARPEKHHQHNRFEADLHPERALWQSNTIQRYIVVSVVRYERHCRQVLWDMQTSAIVVPSLRCQGPKVRSVSYIVPSQY
eukprot:COSAG05_NODE_58_length_23277_cov_16.934162_14_plen_345_part_00